MTAKQIMRWLLAIAMLGACAAAQNDAQQNNAQQNDAQQNPTPPAPAFGQNAPILNPDNPPVSSLDEPGLDLRTASRSFVAPALQLSEAADTNAASQFGGDHLQAVTRVLGALDLQRFWSKADFLAEYLGGGAFYSSNGDAQQMHAAGVEIIDRWRTGSITLRDSFRYLPEGSYMVGAYGGMPGLGLATGGIGTGEMSGGRLFSNTQQGSIGLVPHLANTAVVDIVQSLTPRTAFTVAGGYSNAHFFDDTGELINSDQATGQVGLSHLLNRHDQIAAVYGYQLFRFPQISGGQIQNHIVHARWSHTISGRMSLIVGVGPQYTIVQAPDLPSDKRWSVNARTQLRYKLRRTSLTFSYDKYTSSGSGFFAGADTQAARFGVKHPIARTLDLYSDFGYSHNKRLEPFNGILGSGASHYDEGFAGAVVRKHFGRVWDVFAAYRFGAIGFSEDSSLTNLFCTNPSTFGSCGRISERHTGTVGIEWHPTPTRIE